MHKILTTSAVLSVLGFTTVASADIVSGVAAVAGGNGLIAAMNRAYAACSGISDELSDMKKMAGITTAVSAAGTVAAGVGLGTGLIKSKTDERIEDLQEEIQALIAEQDKEGFKGDVLKIADETAFNAKLDEFIEKYSSDKILAKQEELDAAQQKSKMMGNIRTGTMAASTATNIAGAVMSGTNRIKGDLKAQIAECVKASEDLAKARMQANIEGSADQKTMAHAERIANACGQWSTVDVDKINKKSTGSAITSGIGAATGLAGTVTSGLANSQGVRDGDAQKEKNLNTTANVLAGGTAVASGVATILNATQIKAIKHAATVADECEGALK